jgi:hypothetical protein
MKTKQFIIIISFFIYINLANAQLQIPTDRSELKQALTDIINKKIDLNKVNGKYPLPCKYNVNGSQISFLVIDHGIVSLEGDDSSSDSFILVNKLNSLEKFLNAPNLGALVSQISTLSGVDPWRLFSTSNMMSKQAISSEALLVPLQFCYLEGYNLVFYSLKYTLKKTDTTVEPKDKPIAGEFPTEFFITGKDIISSDR